MEWDQKIFHFFFHLFSRNTNSAADQQKEKQACHLEESQDRLTVLARALTGASIQLHRAEAEGGMQGHSFFLPIRCDSFSEREHNLLFYLFRICFMAQQYHSQESYQGTLVYPGTRHFTQEYTDHIMLCMEQALPNAATLFAPLFTHNTAISTQARENRRLEPPEQASQRSILFGRYIHASTLTGDNDHDASPSEQQAEKQEEEKRPTTRQAPPKEEIESLQVAQEEIDSYTLMHQFEKVETLDEFKGRWREMDGEDDLDEHAEALEELDLSRTVRSDVPAHSVYQADFIAHTSIPESQEQESKHPHLTYPEWDMKQRTYHQDHCKVFLRRYERQDPSYVSTTFDQHRGLLEQMRRKLARFRDEKEKRRRQREGGQLDLDALIDGYTDRAAGRTPDDRVYLSLRPQRSDLAVLVLMDISLSTDAYVENNRILDVEKMAVLLFGQILNEQHERFQIDAFCSRTRNHCHYISLKSFDDCWKHASPTVGGLRPVGYTRIGPAIRHATHLLSAQKAKKKWILFLSDGKPNDYDKYEGSYGVHDVRQSIREAHQSNIHTYALAIDPQARHVLPRLFGRMNYQVLPHPSRLPEAMLYFYSRLLG